MASTFGDGAWGVGDYAAPNVVKQGGASSFGAAGRVRAVVRVIWRGRWTGGAFSSRVRGFVQVRAVAARGFASSGRSSWRLAAVWRPAAAPGPFGGGVVYVFAPRVFRSAARTGFGAGASAWFKLRLKAALRPGAGAWSGRTGHLTLRAVWHGGWRPAASWSAGYRGVTRPIGRTAGATRFSGRHSARMLFKATFRASPGVFSGPSVVSYTWSDLTAPGRTPAPPWGPAIPAASPSDPWQLVPAADGAWTRVE